MQIKQEFWVKFEKGFRLLGSLQILYNLKVKIMLKQLCDKRFVDKRPQNGLCTWTLRTE